MSFDPQVNTGYFVPTTNVWDISDIYDLNVNDEQFKELIVRLYQNINTIALSLNAKDTGYYVPQEFLTGQTFFKTNSTDIDNQRGVYRKLINIGSLAAGVTTVAHGLSVTATWTFLRIQGSASNTSSNNYYPLPFAEATGNNIEVRVDATNVVINNVSGVTFNYAYIILEYIKDL